MLREDLKYRCGLVRLRVGRVRILRRLDGSAMDASTVDEAARADHDGRSGDEQHRAVAAAACRPAGLGGDAACVDSDRLLPLGTLLHPSDGALRSVARRVGSAGVWRSGHAVCALASRLDGIPGHYLYGLLS